MPVAHMCFICQVFELGNNMFGRFIFIVDHKYWDEFSHAVPSIRAALFFFQMVI